ncbi:hypothetical protein ACH5Y9_09295 [Methylomonas sp. BW4-1]|uniref:hypothetical protein n=1 Tax=Methylomonas sp. BW4-1 TaxID=3376685 RepID=UPI00404149DB
MRFQVVIGGAGGLPDAGKVGFAVGKPGDFRAGRTGVAGSQKQQYQAAGQHQRNL